MPGCRVLVNNSTVVAFVPSRSARSLVHGNRDFLLLHHALRDVVTSSDGSGSSAASRMTGFVSSGHRGVQRGEIAHHTLVLVLLVGMNSLCVLTEIVKARELFSTMTGEWTFASVFSDVTSQMLAPAENHATFAITSALKSLCWGWTISFVDGGVGHVGDMVGCDHCGHIFGVARRC